MLRIFSDRKFLPAGKPHTVMLYPFWGKSALEPSENPKNPSCGMFDRYAEVGGRFFEMVSLREADFTILPVAWEHTLNNEPAKNLALEFANITRQAGKQVVVFFWSDADETVPVENAVVFRTSFYRSKKKPNEYAQPSWSEDFIQRYLGSQLPLRNKREKPTIGFCGLAHTFRRMPLKDRTRAALGWGRDLLCARTPSYSWRDILRGNKTQAGSAHSIRHKVLRILSKSPLVETNFVIRDSFLGGGVQPDGTADYDIMQRVRREYVRNMVDSDYIVCVRGAGNFSYRLYETLSCGRIPLFIDTDCVLPYDWIIDWKRFTVWISVGNASEVAERVAAFHEALSPTDFRDLQMACRKLWEYWLCPEGFFANFYRHFDLLSQTKY